MRRPAPTPLRLRRRLRDGASLPFLAACLALALPTTTPGQSSPAAATRHYAAGSIRGTLVVGDEARPAPNATVRVRGTQAECVTAEDGAFRLPRVPPGTYDLIVTGEGLTPIRIVDVVVPAGRTVELRRIAVPEGPRNGIYRLEEYPVHATVASDTAPSLDSEIVSLPQFVVTPSHYGVVQDRVDVAATLTSDELAALPQLGEDLYRTISRLPGLNADDYSAKFWVRGAPNNQMLARFDGLDLVEPFHLKDFDGSMSIIDLQTVQRVDLTTGGFTTEFGDRLAGVMVMESQTYTPGRPANSLGLSLTNLRGTNQGGFADGAGTWSLAARHGYLEYAARLTDSTRIVPPRYYDCSGKIAYRLGADHTVSFHALFAKDTLDSHDEDNGLVDSDYSSGEWLESSYTSAYLWGRWQARFGEKLVADSVFAYAYLDWSRQGGALFYGTNPFAVDDERALDQLEFRQDWTYTLSPRVLVRSGFHYRTGAADYDYHLDHDRWTVRSGVWYREERRIDTAFEPDGVYSAAYLAARVQPLNSLVIEPGVRFDRYSYGAGSHASPRLNLAYSIGRTELRAAWGLYRQAQGLHELSPRTGELTFRDAERAEQRVVGLSHLLPGNVSLRVEAYERLVANPRSYGLNLLHSSSVFPDAYEDLRILTPTRARARGLEFTAEYRAGKRFNWSASYVLARTEERIGGRWTPKSRDQRHTVYLDLTYTPSPLWQFSASWQYHTGWPTTAVGYFMVSNEAGGEYPAFYYGTTNAERLPAYHRLDLRATRRFDLRRGTLRVFVDLFNVYDRANQNSYDHHFRIENGEIVVLRYPSTMFPFIPSAGLSWEF